MKVYRNYIILDNSIKLYDISNLEKAKWIPGYWKEFNNIKKSSNVPEQLPNLRKLLNCFIKENVKLSWAKYYLILDFRQTFHLQHPSLIHYPKVSKSIIPAILSPSFIRRISLIPKAFISYFRNELGKQIIEIENEDIGEFFLKKDVDSVNKYLNILNSPSFNESKLIKEIGNRLNNWEKIESENINRRLYSYSIDKIFKYSFRRGSPGRIDITNYSNLYLSKIGGLL